MSAAKALSVCRTCGKKFKPQPHSRGIYCSMPCVWNRPELQREPSGYSEAIVREMHESLARVEADMRKRDSS